VLYTPVPCAPAQVRDTKRNMAALMLPVDLRELIEAVGYIGLFAIILAETGLLIGFFLPGDSLLFTAGFLASQDILNIWILIPVCFVAAVSGDAVGYAFGKRFGRYLFTREESRLFKPKNLVRAEAFMEHHGGKAIIIARFVPFARTFVPIVAGISAMRYAHFFVYNVTGAVLWAIGLPIAGYYLGSSIPHLEEYLLPAVLLVVAISLMPSAYHVWKEHRYQIRAMTRRQLDALLRRGTIH
jgi:membrane-associated protein